jgi:hypothetical protein
VYAVSAGREKPAEIAAKRQEPAHAHTVAFFEAIQRGARCRHVRVGAEAALTAILGHEAMVKGNTVTWNSLGVNLSEAGWAAGCVDCFRRRARCGGCDGLGVGGRQVRGRGAGCGLLGCGGRLEVGWGRV